MKGPWRVHCPVLCPNNDTPRPALTSRCYPLCNSRQPPFPCLLLCHPRTASTLLPAVCQYLSLSSPARCPSALRQRPTAPHLLCAVLLEAVTTPPPAQTHVGICCCFPVNRIGYVHQSTCRHVPNNTLKKVPSLALEDTLVGQRRCFHEALKAATQNMRIYCLNLLNGHKSIVSSSICSSERCISFSSCRSSSCRGCPSVIRYNERIFISFSYR